MIKVLASVFVAGCVCFGLGVAVAEAAAAVSLKCRSSITGRFVSVAYAKAMPDTTWCKFTRR